MEPSNPEYIFLRGQVYAQKGEADKAAADFDWTVELKPDHVPALMNRSELRFRAKNPEGAREDLDAIDKIAAKQADVRFEMGLAYERLNMFPSAIAQFDLWVPARAIQSNWNHALMKGAGSGRFLRRICGILFLSVISLGLNIAARAACKMAKTAELPVTMPALQAL